MDTNSDTEPDVYYLVLFTNGATDVDRLRTDFYPNGVPTTTPRHIAGLVASKLAERERAYEFQLFRGKAELEEAGY
ncbi:MAG: hypothetical protein KGH74_05510 [Candidatus Micrarchaeota archaeon]|nr:hypothetical protein [Candidatus Micrarchaeota archaeon]